ncbi:hypothetical protein [Pseudonocardia spinosispora]|uniref:hypothetical protein n=1 Tax=Pseudonocardia spinosispora TaxID=103441 RepID=UPI000685FC3C|nr:hypothetical protein [Pseudonocardia spinosispora]
MTDAVLDAERACHDLLVRLAGRVPDRLLWRLRDWLAAGGHSALARSLPKTLLRHRIGLTEAERSLLEACLPEWGVPQRQLDAVLPAAEQVDTPARFRAELAPEDLCTDVPGVSGWRDGVDLMLAAVVRGHPGAKELRRSWRVDRGRPQRVVLAHVTENMPALTGTLQRLLRAHGDLTPCVEIVSPPLALPPYHRMALRDSVSLWRAADREPPTRARRDSGSLVDA